MIVEDNRKDVHTLNDIEAGDAFAIRGKIYIKTNETTGFNEDGSYYRCINLFDGSQNGLHEKTKIDLIKIKVVIMDEDGHSNESD